MLMQLGAVTFEVLPVNVHETDHAVSAGFARHPVLGARPPMEFVGEGPERWRLSGKLFPHEFAGALEGLTALQAMCQSGEPQFYMRGDGVPLGWVVVDQVRERSSYLDAAGVGRVIEFEIALTRCDAPSPDAALNSLRDLLQ
jgi:phage protein U